MPNALIKFYCETDGKAPVNDWLEELRHKNRTGYIKCVARIQHLATMGLEARRPSVEYLRDGIFELRAKDIHIQYRILFFYQDRDIVILTHALVKRSSKVPDFDIDIAVNRKERFEANKKRHTYEREKND